MDTTIPVTKNTNASTGETYELVSLERSRLHACLYIYVSRLFLAMHKLTYMWRLILLLKIHYL